MFEIVVTLCLLNSPDTCRVQLLAGEQHQSKALCEAALKGAALLQGTLAEKRLIAPQAPFCRSAGPGLALSKVSDGVFVAKGLIEEPSASNKGNVSNIGVVIGETSIAVIDSGGSRAIGEDLYRAVTSLSPLPVSHVILTHMHPDHVFGASVFAESGARIVGHPNLQRALQDRQEAYLAGFSDLIGNPGFIGTSIPSIESAEPVIDLGGRRLTLTFWPNAHTATDVTVFDEKSSTFFSGDLVFHDHAPALDGSLKGWQTVLANIQKTANIQNLVPGHGGPVLSVSEGTNPLQHYLEVLETDTRTALKHGERIGDAVEHIGRSEADKWALFELFNTRNATVAYTELEWE
ncbi:quinoprotein relay system zinc metallohydrolase 2 [Roseibium sediminis]|uniref:quinoprotein relay system zinc metallohydrolase 2 n=1 Tax=Roseibium sediminis TaxID=1775174 RepID=UPI00123CEDFD|nr:quinoprotein relay system zinc metallohydrolase 2 [Roseibium sediminis]